MKESRYCPVCGRAIPRKNGKYCSRTCMGVGETGRKRPDLVGKVPWSSGLSAKTDSRIAALAAKKLKDVVGKEELHQLYVIDNMSLKEIGARFGVGKSVIKRLVDKFGLERSPRKLDELTPEVVADLSAQGFRFIEIARLYNCSAPWVRELGLRAGVIGKRFQNHAKIEPTKEMLEQLYEGEWLTYESIGERLGVDLTTIPYWLKKFGIPRRTLWQTRRGRNWVEPDAQVVAHLYEAENMGIEAIGKLFKVSSTFIKAMLRKAKITLRKSGYPNISHYTAQDGHRVKSSLELQVDDWLFTHSIPHQYEGQIGNTNFRTDFVVGDTYIEIWGIIGNQTYENKRKRKLEAYQSHQLTLLSVYPHDFPELHVLNPLIENTL